MQDKNLPVYLDWTTDPKALEMWQAQRFGYAPMGALTKSAANRISAGTLEATTKTIDGKGEVRAVAMDIPTLEALVADFKAYQAANPMPAHDKRGRNNHGTAKPAGLDPRTMLSNRVGDTRARITEAQARAERNHWGVDFQPFMEKLQEIATEAELLAVSKVDAGAIEAAHKRFNELDEALRAFGETDVLQDRIVVAKRGLEELMGSVSTPAYLKVKGQLDEVVERAEAGDARAARAGLYGDEGVFAAIGNLRRSRGGAGSNRQQFTPPPQKPFTATIGERVVAQEAAGSQTPPTPTPARKGRTTREGGRSR